MQPAFSRTAPARARLGEAPIILLLAACLLGLSLQGCHRAPSASPPAAADEKKQAAPEAGVVLQPEEIEKAGIATTEVPGSTRAPESQGYALVITREAIAQAVADLTSAAAVERQSHAALLRTRGLAGTAGAMPAEALEAAERQAAVDHAAFVLAEQRLSATYGQNAPWKANYKSSHLASLASGQLKLARVTFPLGALGSAVPARLRLLHIGAVQGAKEIDTQAVWSAPADASIPGSSFFALVKGSDVNEGERLIAHAAVGAPENGVIVYYSAVVISGDKYWCFVEVRPGVFVRTEIDPDAPTDEGYFVKAGIEPGARVVTTSAGLLLARETNPSTTAD